MDWNTAAACYLARLPRVLDVRHHALALAELPPARVPAELRDALARPVGPLQRQLDRLKKNEFRIAVVGLEKAGKSTFVNAWLGVDLLPNDMKRCTFTTTQLYSVASPGEQRLEVVARTRDQFAGLVAELEARAEAGDGDEARRAAADLEVIRAHRRTLDEVLSEPSRRFPFHRLEDVREPLWRYVADQRYGHAVLETRLYTSELAESRGIVFYDVPGLNSGLARHVEESERMLEDCDAVILIQDSRRPNLEASEQKLIRFVDVGDEAVGIAGKLFVFFGRIDEQGSAEALRGARAEALRDWQARGRLPEDRLIPGSSAAYLLLTHRAGENLKQQTGGLAVVRADLQRVGGVAGDEELKRVSGIPLIKERIGRYLQHERVDVLHRRCREPMAAVLDAARQIFDSVRRRFPEDPEEARKAEENRRGIAFGIWWKRHRWEGIRADVNRALEERVLRPRAGAPGGERAIDSFRRRYREEIAKRMPGLRWRQPEQQQILIGSYSRPEQDPARLNIEWRLRLSAEVREVIERVSGELAMEVTREADALADHMTALLWGSPAVRDRLNEDRPNWKAELRGKLQTLFLRFARPVAEVLLGSPRASVKRAEQIRRLEADVELLDNYYTGGEQAYRRLKLFARYGNELLTNSTLRRTVLGTEEPEARAPGAGPVPEVREARDNEEVVKEVESDLEALEVYLLDAVFAAAGFEAFYEEELRGLCLWFLDQEGAWSGAARNEHLAGNPLLERELPEELRGRSYDTEVSERLRQLRVALDAVEKGG